MKDKSIERHFPAILSTILVVLSMAGIYYADATLDFGVDYMTSILIFGGVAILCGTFILNYVLEDTKIPHNISMRVGADIHQVHHYYEYTLDHDKYANLFQLVNTHTTLQYMSKDNSVETNRWRVLYWKKIGDIIESIHNVDNSTKWFDTVEKLILHTPKYKMVLSNIHSLFDDKDVVTLLDINKNIVDEDTNDLFQDQFNLLLSLEADIKQAANIQRHITKYPMT